MKWINVSIFCLIYFLWNYSMNQFPKISSCSAKFWQWQKEESTKLKSIERRAIVLQQNANKPCEDKYLAIELNNFGGYFISVLDGHGGDQVAEFANERLYKYFDKNYKEIKDSKIYLKEYEIITNAILKTFEQVEKEFYEIAINLYRKGERNISTVGTCVTIALIKPNKLYVVQLGDSKAKLYSRRKDGNYNIVKLTNTHNAKKKIEQITLRNDFTDRDIILCLKSNKKICYVKGRLQVTRSLGDFELKYLEFSQNDDNKKSISRWNGPYIKSVPEIKLFDIEKSDEYIVMATDGLWDYLSSNEVGIIINKYKKFGIRGISNALFDAIFEKAAEMNNMTVEQLMSVPPGDYKRRIHDDITLILFDVKN